MFNKYLKSLLINTQKHHHDLLSVYNSSKIYHHSVIALIIIKSHIKVSYEMIELFLKNVTVMTEQMKKKNNEEDIIVNIKKNTQIKKTKNEYFITFQKLNNVVTLKLMMTMKEAVKISENVIDDN